MIAKLPVQDRPRERLWERGVEALSERELLAARGSDAVLTGDPFVAVRPAGWECGQSARNIGRAFGEHPAHRLGSAAGLDQPMFAQDDEVGEIAHAGVLTVTELEQHGVELFRDVARDRHHLDRWRFDSGETEVPVQPDAFGVEQLMRATDDVHLDAPEWAAGKLAVDTSADEVAHAGDGKAFQVGETEHEAVVERRRKRVH